MQVVRVEPASHQRPHDVEYGRGQGGLTVYYGLSGEGLGHVRRAAPVLEFLRARARVIVLTSGQALDVVRAQFRESDIEVRAVPGYHFRYNAWGRLSIGGTLAAASRAALEVRFAAERLAEELNRRPAVVISDFEPITVQAAAMAGVTSLGIDHQRLLQVCDFQQASARVRLYVEVLRNVVELLYGRPQRLVVSGFYLPPIHARFSNARTAGVTIREPLLQAAPSVEPYLLAYVRRECPIQVLRALEKSPLPVHLYGRGAGPRVGQVRFCDASREPFVERLARCAGVVTTAGNQLIGEAFFLRKPVLAFPEPGNPEQHINAWLLNESKGGMAVSHRHFTTALLEGFVGSRQRYASRLEALGQPGNDAILDAVQELLDEARQPKVCDPYTWGSSVPAGMMLRARPT